MEVVRQESATAKGRIRELGERFSLLRRQGDRGTSGATSSRPASARVSLPDRVDGAVRVEAVASRMALEFSPRGLLGDSPVQFADGFATFALTDHPSISDVLQRSLPSGVEDYIVLAHRPAQEEIRYDLKWELVAGLRLVSNCLELLDARGTPRLRVAHPFLMDSDGKTHVAKLSVEGCAVDISPLAPWGRPVVDPGARACVVKVSWEGRDVAYPAVLDPTWTTTGDMSTPRIELTATSLPDEHVLVAGGESPQAIQASAELFDPATLTFAMTDSMADARRDAASVLLPSGKVLIVGGYKIGAELAGAELYDPAKGTFTSTGSMKYARYGLTATALPSGSVLVAGGSGGPFQDSTDVAETYDPQTEAFADTGTMTQRRQYHAAVLLDADTVLLAGGVDRSGGADRSAELWTASTGEFTSTGLMNTSRRFPAAAALPAGKALVFGTNTADIFDLVSGKFSSIAAIYGNGTATVLSDNEVLLAGQAAGLYVPALGKIVSSTGPENAHAGARAALLPEDRVLVVGGYTTLADVWHRPLAGEACASDSECKDGLCGRGYCCAAACPTCSQCVEGSGACEPLKWAQDEHSCTSPNVCDGEGVCKLNNGQPCGSDSTLCATAFCVDSVCCGSACGDGDPNDGVACSKQAGGSFDGSCTPKIGTPCDDARPCTIDDKYTADGCFGTAVVCQQETECNTTYCTYGTGQCDSYIPIADGTSCSVGVCQAGVCVSSNAGGAGGESGVGGTSDNGGASGGEGGAPVHGQAGMPTMAGAPPDGGGPTAGVGGEPGSLEGAAGHPSATGGASDEEPSGSGRGGMGGGDNVRPSGGAADDASTAGAVGDGSHAPRLSRGCGCAVVGAQSESSWLIALLYSLAFHRRARRRANTTVRDAQP